MPPMFRFSNADGNALTVIQPSPVAPASWSPHGAAGLIPPAATGWTSWVATPR